MVVVSYYSKKCLICDRAQPILEDVGTQFYRDAEFAMIDVDKPQFKSLCLEQVRYNQLELASSLENQKRRIVVFAIFEADVF